MTRFPVFWAPGVQILQILCDILFCYINMIMFFISFFWTAYNFFWRILPCRIPVMVLKWKSNNFKFFCQRLTVNYPPPPLFSNFSKCSRNINFKDIYIICFYLQNLRLTVSVDLKGCVMQCSTSSFFFRDSNSSRPLIKSLKYFRIRLRFSRDIRFTKCENFP